MQSVVLLSLMLFTLAWPVSTAVAESPVSNLLQRSQETRATMPPWDSDLFESATILFQAILTKHHVPMASDLPWVRKEFQSLIAGAGNEDPLEKVSDYLVLQEEMGSSSLGASERHAVAMKLVQASSESAMERYLTFRDTLQFVGSLDGLGYLDRPKLAAQFALSFSTRDSSLERYRAALSEASELSGNSEPGAISVRDRVFHELNKAFLTEVPEQGYPSPNWEHLLAAREKAQKAAQENSKAVAKPWFQTDSFQSVMKVGGALVFIAGARKAAIATASYRKKGRELRSLAAACKKDPVDIGVINKLAERDEENTDPGRLLDDDNQAGEAIP